MKRKTQTEDVYVVVHKNPDNPRTNRGKQWAVDGLVSSWSYSRAELHAKRCEYAMSGIECEIIPINKVHKYVPSLRVAHDDEEE